MNKIKIGVLGGFRGESMIHYAKVAKNAELVAICDKNPVILNEQKENYGTDGIEYYDNFDEFIKHDMDAVVLANYAHQHAPFAIKALKAGKHVFSEVLPCQTLKEAVELIEAVEETGKIYAYGENYCYMNGPMEMKRLYENGTLGELKYAEGEYIHNCHHFWHTLTYGEKNHWRNRMYCTFYCTHSLGPIIHITGLRPTRVTGFEGPINKSSLERGVLKGSFGIEMVEMENGSIVKSTHGGLFRDSIWYTLYGSKGRIETAREDAEPGLNYPCVNTVLTNIPNLDNPKIDMAGHTNVERYKPDFGFDDIAANFHHGGSDFYCMYYFVRKLQGYKDGDIIDVYEAMDMFLPGMFAYRSILAGGIPVEIPNLRNKEVREKYRNDTTCTDPEVAGDMLIPSYSKGNPHIPDEVYEKIKVQFEEYQATKSSEKSFKKGIISYE